MLANKLELSSARGVINCARGALDEAGLAERIEKLLLDRLVRHALHRKAAEVAGIPRFY